MSRIDKVKYIGRKDSGGKHSFGLYINEVDLLEHLEEAFSHYAPKSVTWKERNDCRLVSSELKRSLKESGQFDIIDTCVGHLIPADVLLERSIYITQDSEFVTWVIQPPGAGVHFETESKLTFKFSKKQYLEEITKAAADKENALVNQPTFYTKD